MTSRTRVTAGAANVSGSRSSHRRAWYFAATAVFLVSLLAAGVWTFLGLWSSWQAPDDFARTALPGTLTVQVDEPSTQYLYVEHPDRTQVAPLEQLEIQVTGPGVEPVTVVETDMNVEYDAPDGDLGTLVGEFQATAAGSYTVTATAPTSGLTLAAGASVTHPLTSALLGSAVVAGLGTVVAVVFVATGFRRP